MNLADLVALLRMDLADSEHGLFEEATLERCIQKAVLAVNRDLGLSLGWVGNALQPKPLPIAETLLLLMGQVHACQLMRAATANAFSFSSGDKRVDKGRQPEHWARLEKDLLAQYREHLAAENPDGTPISEESVVLQPGRLLPLIYDQGSDL